MALRVDADGFLTPIGRPYLATLDDVYETFVQDAPFRARRELIFRALSLHLEIARQVVGDATVWLDGGFVTHKQWAAPEDADVALIVPTERMEAACEEPGIPLWTLLGVSASQPGFAGLGKLHPMGGLIDAFFIPDIPEYVAPWRDRWSSVSGPDGVIIEGKRKGYVEVVA